MKINLYIHFISGKKMKKVWLPIYIRIIFLIFVLFGVISYFIIFRRYNIIYFCCQIDFLDSMFKKKDMHDFSVSMLKFVTVMFCFAVEHVLFFVFVFFTWFCLFSFGSSLFFV